LLVESLLFSVVAGAVGLLVAVWAINIANRIDIPMNIHFSPDLRLSPLVMGFALAVTALTGMLFGIMPALQATRPSLIPALKGEAPAGESRSRTSKGLVIAQMALSMVLLVCAALFLVNLRSATTLDKGFSGENILLADLSPGLQGYPKARTQQFYRQIADRLRTDPRVRDVAYIEDVPLGVSNSDRGVTIPGYVPAPNEGMSVMYTRATPGYFQTMGVAMRAGRDFTAQDDSATTPVLIVNERFAERFWPGQQAVGKTVQTSGRDFTVIGVVATNARLNKEATNKVAQMAHDGLARAVRPAHTMYDGDTFFALASGEIPADVNVIGAYGAEVVAQAIRNGIRAAQSLGGVRSCCNPG